MPTRRTVNSPKVKSCRRRVESHTVVTVRSADDRLRPVRQQHDVFDAHDAETRESLRLTSEGSFKPDPARHGTRDGATGGGTYSADTAIAVPLLKVVRLVM